MQYATKLDAILCGRITLSAVAVFKVTSFIVYLKARYLSKTSRILSPPNLWDTTSALEGSKVHDEIYYNGDYFRKTNNAGGIEGGMSNGEEIVLRAAMKPIPTLMKGLKTV